MKAQNPGKPVNYTSIAIKGLLFHYKPANAIITVDGESFSYKKVWIAAAMKGRYYGGGMMTAPKQDRLADDGKVTLVVMYGSGKLKTLMVFPSIFKGEHVNHTEMVAVHTGKEITVTFDRPTPLQIDGETVLGVTSYKVSAGKKVLINA
jgi:diacylglycerol kinase family enzyme